MESDDLARPVIQVQSYGDEIIQYEIYSYGDSVVVMPCEHLASQVADSQDGIKLFAQQALEKELKMLLNCRLRVEVI
ncbi:MAG: hypothetical protein H6765_09765 [Candidatus Peribacteria bacterium]|nr:MAG: hypothetical protein H6765_09765 [Candidatus Peribacteria bacterium]